MSTVWSDLHQDYKNKNWIDKPSIFAQTVIDYFPKHGKILDLGAGQAQDSRFFAEHGYQVVSSDIEASAQDLAKSKLPTLLKNKIEFQTLDLREELPYGTDIYDVVYAHLSLHYFDNETTIRLFDEIQRVLKPGGTLAFLVNSINDPEYMTGIQIEPDYFKVGKANKRFFSVESARNFTQYFECNLLDNLGETYKDNDKGIHNLVRFVGTKTLRQQRYTYAIPYVGAIVERDNNGVKEVMVQTRWKPNADPLYSGTLEFPAGTLDKPFENIYVTLAREIKEETGLTLKLIKNDSQTKQYSPNRKDLLFGFKPFCCTQQLRGGKPWIGFVFVCVVENGEPKAQLSESKNPHWIPVNKLREIVKSSPEKLFGLELPAWEYYLNHIN